MATSLLRTKLEGRLAGLRNERYSWWSHYAELARFILPRRYRWLVTPNQMNRGGMINGAIIDSTGTIAARVLASGMMSGITSPTRPWFNLTLEGYDKDEINSVNIWLTECRRRMMRVFQESNFYNCIAVVYMDLAVFGTAPMLIYENFENVIWCCNPCAGEYYAGNDQYNMVRIFYREITKTASQMLEEWPTTISENVKNLTRDNGTGLTQEIVVCHAIQANDPSTGINKKFPWAEFYWEKGSSDEIEFLSKRGFYEWPGMVPRWDVSGNDAYGRSPGMDALGDIKQLQQETRRKAQAIDKLANPPMVADVELKNAPASTLPGGVTYITRKDGAGFKPAYENFRPPIQELMADIMEVQKRIKGIFFNDLFLMFQELQAEPRSAAAVDARREEKLVMLGPVLERFQTEALDPAIDRTFGIMMRGGLFPPPPPEIQGKPIQVEYSSMLAAAQSAASTAAIERVLAVVGNAAAIHPDVLDTINWDATIQEYSSLLGNDPKLMNTPEQIAAVREAKAQQQKLAYLTELGQGAAKAGKTLSETDLGGGQNALQAMTGGGQQ